MWFQQTRLTRWSALLFLDIARSGLARVEISSRSVRTSRHRLRRRCKVLPHRRTSKRGRHQPRNIHPSRPHPNKLKPLFTTSHTNKIMSSQGQGAAFYNMPDSSGYRLIELPPELEATLTAPGAPVYVTMHRSLAKALLCRLSLLRFANKKRHICLQADCILSPVQMTPPHYAARMQSTDSSKRTRPTACFFLSHILRMPHLQRLASPP